MRRDVERCAALLEAHHAGTLTDVKLFAAIAAARADAVAAERQRIAERLQAVARAHLARGERLVAELFAAEADALEIAPPPELAAN